MGEWDDDSDNDNERLFSAEGKEINGSKSRLRKIIDAVKSRAKKDGLRLFLLVLGNGLYLYLGGIVFYFLEKQPKHGLEPKKHIEMLLNVLQRSSLTNTSFGDINTSDVVNELSNHDILQLTSAIEKIHTDWQKYEASEWTLTTSVFFASTVVTTIGYGNLAPTSLWGRLFCVIYAIIGIPLTLMLLAMVGKILSTYINDLCGFIVTNLRKYLYPEYEYDRTDEETDLNAPVWLALGFIMMFISLDALVFMYMEGWTFPMSLYFIFITLTTIGFGDIVPHNTAVVWFNVTLLYIGLAAVSITINLLIANINLQYRKHKAKLKFVKKLEKELDSDGEQANESTPLTDCNRNETE